MLHTHPYNGRIGAFIMANVDHLVVVFNATLRPNYLLFDGFYWNKIQKMNEHWT